MAQQGYSQARLVSIGQKREKEGWGEGLTTSDSLEALHVTGPLASGSFRDVSSPLSPP